VVAIESIVVIDNNPQLLKRVRDHAEEFLGVVSYLSRVATYFRTCKSKDIN